jgi:glucose-1-phosphate thymidylyltransferase
MQAFILAGGFATRLWPLTEKRAKPLLPLAGKPIITHIVEKIPQNLPITVSTNAVFENQFHTWKSHLQIVNSKLQIVMEDTTHDDHKLGALGAVAQWITNEHIDEDILLLTGDNYLGFSMEKFLSAYNEGAPLVAVHDIQDRERARQFGVVVTQGLKISEFIEKPSNPPSTLVSTGCSIIPRALIPTLIAFAKNHPDNVGGIFEEFLRKNVAVECFTFSEPWLDIGSFQSYLEAHRLLVGENVLADAFAYDVQTKLSGSITIGNASIVRESELTDCMVLDHCRINDCVLRECIIDNDCVLEGIDLTGKMIRAGTVLQKRLQAKF